MSVRISTERRMLRGTEFETVARTHYPDIFSLSKDELAEILDRDRFVGRIATETPPIKMQSYGGVQTPRGFWANDIESA
jgi:hypothetical protein